MSKSILVIDTPKNCRECKFSEYQGIVCRAMGLNKAHNNADSKPDWCPLEEIKDNDREEIQQYRAIGTVEECREAREKQRARKPKIWTTPDDGVNLIYDMYKCPNCGKEHKIDYYNEYSYCPNCGQAVKLFE